MRLFVCFEVSLGNGDQMTSGYQSGRGRLAPLKKPRDGHREGQEGGNLSGRKSWAQALWTLGQTGQGWWEPSGSGPTAPGAPRPRPPPGAGAELRAGPGRHMRWNPGMHPPCSAAGAQQRAGRPFSPARTEAQAAGFHLRGAGSGSHLREAPP